MLFSVRRFFLFSTQLGDCNILSRRKTTPIDQRKDYMHGPQIERLKRDSSELKHYITRLEKEGNDQLVYKLQKKHQYLTTKIEDLNEALLN
jgi:hypothetical protein|tara:strand:+ start:146 stop:418 length:273 start_codon:yes stop_codon:yes gene_type:complete